MPGQSWPASAGMFLLMWLVMMVAMMLPSACPMLLGYRRSLAAREPKNTAASVLFVACGYFFIWLVIGALVFITGIAFASAAMWSPALSRATPFLSGIALIIAGGLQFTSWKMAGLCRCRAGGICALRQGPGIGRASWRHGLGQGISCAVCCAAPMLVLLILGAMDLRVMAVITIVIAIEKLAPHPEKFVRFFGIAAVAAGVLCAARVLPGHG